MFPAVIVPVVLIVFDPKLANKLVTLAFEYSAGSPLN